MSKPSGLTKPQWELLVEVVRKGSCYAAEHYRPRIALQDCGLIRPYGLNGHVTATERGIELVNKSNPREEA